MSPNQSLFDDDVYKYRLVFTYPAQPRKIPLPNVGYRPNQAIFYYPERLGEDSVKAVSAIALRLAPPLPNVRVTCAEEFKEGNDWKVYEEDL